MYSTQLATHPAASELTDGLEREHHQRIESMKFQPNNELMADDVVVSTNATVITTMVQGVVPVEQPLLMSEPPCIQKPINFGVIEPGLYRSGYPQAQDYPFIKSLNIKTIVTLVSKEMPEGYQSFMDANGISHKVFDMAGTKKQVIDLDMMQAILEVVADNNNYPLLIHCNHGKHRTGCVVGLIRKASQWDVPAILSEYTHYASPKVRDSDLEYLTKFNHLHLEDARRKLILKSTATTMTVNTHTRASPPPFTVGSFVFFVLVASVALCIFIFTGRTFSRPPPPRRRDHTS